MCVFISRVNGVVVVIVIVSLVGVIKQLVNSGPTHFV